MKKILKFMQFHHFYISNWEGMGILLKSLNWAYKKLCNHILTRMIPFLRILIMKIVICVDEIHEIKSVQIKLCDFTVASTMVVWLKLWEYVTWYLFFYILFSSYSIWARNTCIFEKQMLSNSCCFLSTKNLALVGCMPIFSSA